MPAKEDAARLGRPGRVFVRGHGRRHPSGPTFPRPRACTGAGPPAGPASAGWGATDLRFPPSARTLGLLRRRTGRARGANPGEAAPPIGPPRPRSRAVPVPRRAEASGLVSSAGQRTRSLVRAARSPPVPASATATVNSFMRSAPCTSARPDMRASFFTPARAPSGARLPVRFGLMRRLMRGVARCSARAPRVACRVRGRGWHRGM